MDRNLNARLSDGTMFDFWEKECKWERTLYMDCNHPAGSDANDGSEAAPFRTINAAGYRVHHRCGEGITVAI